MSLPWQQRECLQEGSGQWMKVGGVCRKQTSHSLKGLDMENSVRTMVTILAFMRLDSNRGHTGHSL